MLELRNISKSFSGVQVLHDVSFKIAEGRVTALMGENGAGKSTLMKILGGVISDYDGEIFFEGREIKSSTTKQAEQTGIAMIHQELNLVPDLSIGENIFLGQEPVNALGFINFKNIHAHTNQLLKDFDFPYPSNQSVRNIGLGWQQLIEIVKALNINSRVIIMDEPTSSLTEGEKEILFKKIKYLKGLGKSIIFISHRMSEVFEIADEVVIMRDGKNVGQSEISTITRQKIVELMIGKSLSSYHFRPKQILPDQILQVKNLSVTHNAIDKLKNISFAINKGEVLGLAGLLGSGRTSLLKFLFGALDGARYSGEILFEGSNYSPRSIRKAQRKHICFLPEDRKAEGIFPLLGIGDNTSASILDKISTVGFINRKAEVAQSTKMLAGLNTKYSSLYQLITRLSGGNQQKVLLSRLLLAEPGLILLDDPTRGIDVGAKEEIYGLIQKLSSEGISFIVSSSEIHELEQVCNKILVLSSGHQTALLETNKTNSTEVLKYAFEKV